MEGTILDADFNPCGLIEVFDSFIWTDRYLGYGDFELYMPVSANKLYPLQQDQYLTIRKSDRLMIVETLETSTTVDAGSKLTVSGRSLESILDRRIVWGTRTLSGNFQDSVQALLNENAINPSDPARRIPNLIFKRSSNPTITSLTVDTQFIGENLYDAIYILCENRGVGFRIKYNEASSKLEFELYMGVDYSFAQTTRPSVIFSSHFENLIASNYIESRRALKTAALIIGEERGDENNKSNVYADIPGNRTGLQRREIYVEASSVKSKNDDDTDIPDTQYLELLREKGREELAKTTATTSFEGEIDAQRQFVYGRDFAIGDIVQVINEYGMEAQSRVSELIITHNAEGETYFPTFVTIEED